ncbi:DUF3027 domain-containing protein [Mycolicibacterium confluentis]|uniref:Uncharacterized protein n=1 Tax=Mycolicibacterium confluentis TaxID=28047 RepID=A0A7I7XRC4_9MYCO|nr:DUF3027 domain-containing protein [Mycolicibacterium confluentis]MCV7318642.1 DUF3027 domain-containing protein [Mycolicibacterium confluentis]ORV23223.1 hypothetical protein AWB99_25320 [Mycolicibacterium confluentis]BBZ31789.1 hypothetical protein MCNF_03940 [Mycolicibacterium confluentis]
MESATDYTEQPTDESPATVSQAGTDVPDELSALLLGAVDLARAAVEELSAGSVGEYLGASHEDSTSATHRFLAELTGYRGWQWAVVVAAYPGASHATVSEVVLVPGPTALLAPEWVPWEQRVRPGDLSPGDLLAPPAEDPRLVPGFMLNGDPDENRVAAELGIGRRQVMSAWGRDDAAQRWHDSDFGPESAMARSTKRACRDCGFLLPLAGSLGTMFGVCGNAMAADGHVVDFGYGCGAHSDTPAPAGAGSPLFDPYDDGVLDVAANPVPQAAAEAPEAEDVTEEPLAEETAAEVLVVEQAAEEPVADEPAAEGSVAQEATEEPAEEPVAEDAAAEEPKAEEVTAEEPAAEEPATETAEAPAED